MSTGRNSKADVDASGRKKWNLIVDVALCQNCNNCVLSAKDEYVGNDHKGYSAAAPEEGADLIKIARKVRGSAPVVDTAYLVKMCNHCDEGNCMKVGGDAVKKRDDGIVIIDPVKAKGRKDIVDACPHNAIVWNEESQLPQIWTFDAHLLDAGWTQPRCVDACPTSAIEATKISNTEMSERVQREGLRVLEPELETKPRVYYRNLDRFDKCFIGGVVVAKRDGVEDCADGAIVSLMRNGDEIGRTQTDEFGEFKFDKLEPESGAYEVRVRDSEAGDASITVALTDSVFVGVLTLE
ncbi:MAG: 4Fe-4S dicluster domain-containing protein [Pseudomonadota bacterium]